MSIPRSRWIRLVLALAFFLVATTAPAQGPPTDPGLQITGQSVVSDEGYELQLPQGWQAETDPARVNALLGSSSSQESDFAASHPGSSGRITVMVADASIRPTDRNRMDFERGVRDGISGSGFPEPTLTSSLVTYGTTRCIMVEYSQSMFGQTVFARQCVVPGDGKSYIVMVIALEADRAECLTAFTSLMTSFNVPGYDPDVAARGLAIAVLVVVLLGFVLVLAVVVGVVVFFAVRAKR